MCMSILTTLPERSLLRRRNRGGQSARWTARLPVRPFASADLIGRPAGTRARRADRLRRVPMRPSTRSIVTEPCRRESKRAPWQHLKRERFDTPRAAARRRLESFRASVPLEPTACPATRCPTCIAIERFRRLTSIKSGVRFRNRSPGRIGFARRAFLRGPGALRTCDGCRPRPPPGDRCPTRPD